MSKLAMVGMGVALAAGLLLFTATAAAGEGLCGSPAQLPVAQRAKLAAAIDGYRATHPQAFVAVHQVKGHRPEVYRKARNPKPMVGPELRRLGAPALLPMLEALAFAAPERRGATAAEWQALEVGMLQCWPWHLTMQVPSRWPVPLPKPWAGSAIRRPSND
ncbi:MAG: hypothetical protein JRI68_33345 [Deltaproteobacteria bacterium]|nr:hypothetical protein [Deltaproteobacteria bacterium]